jgi:hypothetical protein
VDPEDGLVTATGERPLGIAGRVLLLLVLAIGCGLARYDAFTMLFYSSYAAVGALLAFRRPRNTLGWLLVAIAFGFVGTTTSPAVDVAALRAGTATWADFLVGWASGWAAYATFGGFIALMVLFPSGTLGTGRWRRAAILALGLSVAITIIAAIAPVVSYNPDGGAATIAIPNRFAVLPDLAIWNVIPVDSLIVPTVVLLACGVVSLVIRYRRAVGVVLLQLRWFVAALAFMLVAITFGLSTLLVFGEDLGALTWVPAIVAYPLVPAAIYVAISRYRLYEIDRIVSRTIGWALVTGLLLAVFAGTIVGLQTVLAPFTNNNTLAVAGSTLVAAALFQPLRARVQRAVDRRFNRARVDAQRAIDAFGVHLRDDVDLTALRGRLVHVATEALQPAGAELWIRETRS